MIIIRDFYKKYLDINNGIIRLDVEKMGNS